MIAYPASLLAVGGAKTGIAPVNLLDVQTVEGDLHYWSDRPMVAPNVINALNNADAAKSVSAAAQGPPPPPAPPVPVPAGQLVAWSLPTIAAAATNGGTVVDGSVTVAAYSAQIIQFRGSSVGQNTFTGTWSGFKLPDLPTDAVIQSIWPVIVASGQGSGAYNTFTAGPSINMLNATPGGEDFSPIASQTEFESTEFTATFSLGNTAATVTGMQIGARVFQTSNTSFYQEMDISYIGLAIYYTSASQGAAVNPGGSVSVTLGAAMPWATANGQNANYLFGKNNGAPPVAIPLALTAGQQITVAANGSMTAVTGGTASGPAGLASDLTGNKRGPSGTHYPTNYMPPGLGLGGLCGAFTSSAGNVIEPLSIGTGATFTVPAGATQIQLGINDDDFSGASGSYNVTVTAAAAPQLDPTQSNYLPWLLSVPSFTFHRSLQTDIGAFVLQNLSGDTLARDFETIARRSALEGAFFVYRLWQADAEAAWLEVHGTLTVEDVSIDRVQLRGAQLLNPAQDDTPLEVYCEQCQLNWGGKRCGSTQATECLYSFQTCQVVERIMVAMNDYEKNFGETTANTADKVINRRRRI